MDGKIEEIIASIVCRNYEGMVKRTGKGTTKHTLEKSTPEFDKALCWSWKAGDDSHHISPE